jgi:hypothetical protein
MLSVPLRWIALSPIALAVAVLYAPGAPAAPIASAARVQACPGFSFSDAGGKWKVSHVKRTSQITCTKAKNLIRVTYGSGPLKVIHVQMTPGHPILWVAGGWRCTITPRLVNGDNGAVCNNVKHPSWNEVGSAAVMADLRFPTV